MIDSQSVKSSFPGEERGFHGGKLVKGRSRQVSCDIEGNVWGVHVHAADKSDTAGGIEWAEQALEGHERLSKVIADQGYKKSFIEHLKKKWKMTVETSMSVRDPGKVSPKRWIAERCFAWLNGWRICDKEHERTTSSSEVDLHIIFTRRTLRAAILR